MFGFYRSNIRAQRGFDLLSDRKPGFWRHVHLETLDLRDPRHCVLTQLYGSYRKGLWNMGLDDDRDSFEEVHYGFCPGFWDDLCSKGRRLTMAWQRFILEAQLQAELPDREYSRVG